MKIPFETALYGTFRHLPGCWRTALFLLFFLLNFTFGFGQEDCTITSSAPDPTDEIPIPLDLNFEGPINRELIADDFVVINGNIRDFNRGTPEFIKEDSGIPLSNFDLNVKPDEISLDFEKTGALLAQRLAKSIISITELDDSHMLLLTYGDGVKLLNKNGNITNEEFINSSLLNSPLDIEATNYLQNPNPQIIYIADKEDLMIKRFGNAGEGLTNWGTGELGDGEDEFYGPTGLVSDSNYVYLVDAYTGGANGMDLVKIYDHHGNLEYTLSEKNGYDFFDPYRIAVDKQGRIYVADGESDAEEDLGRIQIFQKNLNDRYELIHTIEGEANDSLGAPGSMVVDDYGYLYVIDYQDDLTLSSIFESPEDLILNYDEIVSKEYSINVYDTNQGNFNLINTFNDGLNLPIDLEMGNCGKIYVNNLKLSGPGLNPNWIQMILAPFLFPGQNVIETNFDFQLKTFTRHDNFTAEVTPKSEGLVEVSLNAENEFFPCDPQPECDFSRVYGEEGTPAPVEITCPADKPINLDQNCSFLLPNYTGEASTTPGASVTQEPAPGTVFSSSTIVPVTLTAKLNGETTSCTFDVTPVDTESPIIDCQTSVLDHSFPAGGNFVVPAFYENRITDNCNDVDDLIIEQNPPVGTLWDVSGTYTVTYFATDTSGNRSIDCTVIIELTEETNLSIACPADKPINLDQNCSFTLPNYIDEASATPGANITQDPASGTIFSGTTEVPVTLIAELNGEITSCTFDVVPADNSKPIIDCPTSVLDRTFPAGGNFVVPAFYENRITDNCNDVDDLIIEQNPPVGTLWDVSGTYTVTYFATDTSGNRSIDCTVIIELTEETSGGGTSQCTQSPITLQLNQSGTASLQLDDLYTGDASGLDLNASQLDFTCADLGENTIELSWTGENSGSCEITVIVEDNIKPVAEVSFIGVTLDANGLAEITPEDLDAGSYDNCGTLDFSLSKSRFTCEDTGQNTVVFTATDASGNSVSVNTIVSVNANPDSCTEPARDNEYVFLYPNPTDGLVIISAPDDVTVEQVLVFDKRGRFILSKEFDKNDLEYEFRLDGVQNAVYTLRILTNEGEIIRRLIIRN